MPWQLSCHSMYKNMLLSQSHELNCIKIILIVSHLNYGKSLVKRLPGWLIQSPRQMAGPAPNHHCCGKLFPISNPGDLPMVLGMLACHLSRQQQQSDRLTLYCSTCMCDKYHNIKYFCALRLNGNTDGILITGRTCLFDNFQCSLWWKFRQNATFPLQRMRKIQIQKHIDLLLAVLLCYRFTGKCVTKRYCVHSRTSVSNNCCAACYAVAMVSSLICSAIIS